MRSLTTHSTAASLWIGGALAGVFILGAAGCGSTSYDASTSLGKKALIEAVKLKLTQQDCDEAVAMLAPVYGSIDTDNDIRMLMASTYGCDAHINYFNVLGDIVSDSSTIAGSGLWGFLATEFPSTTSDRVPEAGLLAQDALQSVISPSAVVLSNNLFNTTSFNPDAYNVDDRLSDSTAYLFFTSMAVMGGIESRSGNPLPSDWTVPTTIGTNPASIDADGCAYASAVVNFADSLDGLVAETTGKFQTTVSGLQTALQTVIYSACDQGCQLCGIAGGCPTCPTELRNRTGCTPGASDPPSCAAAAIVSMVNLSWGT